MLVFADFDNVDGLIKSRGVGHIIERIVNSVSRLPIAAQPRIDVRFYGGWFSEDRLSKRGQEISAELSGSFPKVHTVKWEGESEPVNVRVNGHIARGISACESVHLYHTFRRRPFSGQLYFKRSVRERCSSPNCPLDVIEPFILNIYTPIQAAIALPVEV